MKRDITCITCPLGCRIRVTHSKGTIHGMEGYKCGKGKEYAVAEVFNPKRSLATTLTVINGELPLVSVKTSKPVPKQSIFEVMDAIGAIEVDAPVAIGDILVEQVLGLDVDIIATKHVKKSEK